jgi:hypothetical protein
MPDPRSWLSDLSELAPRVDRTLLRITANLLASHSGSDALLILSDALREAGTELLLDGRERLAADMLSLALLVSAEAGRRPDPQS